MWKRIYLGALAIGIVVAGFFAFYAWSWLQSIGEPRAAWESFNYHKRGGVYFLIAWTAVMLFVASGILWKTGRAWALWVSDAYFAVFAIVFLIWLHLGGTDFCLENRVCQEPSRLVGPLLAVLGIVVLSAAIFADRLILLKLREKFRQPAEPAADPESESSQLE